MIRFFKYQLKAILSEKSMLFWIFAFPILLCTIFNFAFSNMSESTLFKPFDVAVVGNKNADVIKVMKDVKFENESAFKMKFIKEDVALKLLNDKEVEGIIKLDKNDNPTLVINKQDTNQMILQEMLNSYKQGSNLIATSLKDNPQLMQTDWLNTLNFGKDNVENKSISEKTNNLILVSFFSVIGMSCMYGALIAAFGLRTLRPNLSVVGARVSISPYPKTKIVFSNFLASYLVSLLSLITLICFMKFVINIDFGNLIISTIMICVVGSLLATAVGYFITLALRLNENSTVGIIVSFTMIGSFFAGMMAPAIAYSVKTYAPIVAKLNPVGLITDSFTLSYYYEDFNMILPNIFIMLIMSIVLLLLSIILLRRNQYECI